MGEQSVLIAGRAQPPPTGLMQSGGNATVMLAPKKLNAKILNFTAKNGDITVFLKKLDLCFTLQPKIDQDKIATMLSAMDKTAFSTCQHIFILAAHMSDYRYWRCHERKV